MVCVAKKELQGALHLIQNMLDYLVILPFLRFYSLMNAMVQDKGLVGGRVSLCAHGSYVSSDP